MLIEKTLSPQDVVTIKLVSQEEIVARLVEITEDRIVVSRPMSLVMARMQDGQGVVAMAPFMLGAEEAAKLPIRFSAVVTYAKARGDAAAQYIQATSSLAVPTPGQGLGGLSGLGGLGGLPTNGPTSPLKL